MSRSRRPTPYFFPLMVSVFAVMAAIQALDRAAPEQSLVTPLIVGGFLCMAMGGLVSIGGRPADGARAQANAREAYRSAAYAAIGGFAAVAVTTLYAPSFGLIAVIAAAWATSMTGLVRFGLLQRAGEGGDA